MKKSFIFLILLILLLASNSSCTNFTNYYNNLTQMEKNMIKFYSITYPNTFFVINMIIQNN